MSGIESIILIGEIKGLLSVLEREAANASFQLASDNVYNITDHTAVMRTIINKIEDKINVPRE